LIKRPHIGKSLGRVLIKEILFLEELISKF
jgi:hypothetical protein